MAQAPLPEKVVDALLDKLSTDDDFRAQAREAIGEFSRRPPDEQLLDQLLERIRYLGIPFDNVPGYAKLGAVMERLAAQGKLGPVARLMPTTTATTLRKDREPPLVIDGPFAETKEQLLGFYIVDCANLAEVLSITRELAEANPGGAYEIRPVGVYFPAKAVP